MTVSTINGALGRRVIAVDSAEEIGEIKGFVVDRTVSAIDKVHVAGRKKKALFIDWSDLESFGDDAVMASSGNAPAEAQTERDVDSAKGDIDIIGARILDVDGFEHGTVDDVQFDADTGKIVTIIGSDNTTHTADAIASLGSYALVVRI